MADDDRQRIDKWLWFARCAKTRTTAQKLIVAGRVRVNRDKIDSASRAVRVGDVLTVSLDAGIRVLRVRALGKRRGPAEEARTLYEDLSPPADPDQRRALPRPGPRPTKRNRRALDAFASPGANDDDFSE